MAKKPAPLQVAEVGAFKRRTSADVSRRMASLIALLEIDADFAAKPKKFEAINLVDGRDFLQETDTYDIVILHSILSPALGKVNVPGAEDELMISPEHSVEAWKERLVETEAKYIVVCEGQPYTLSGYELGKLPGYKLVQIDQWLAVYKKTGGRS